MFIANSAHNALTNRLLCQLQQQTGAASRSQRKIQVASYIICGYLRSLGFLVGMGEPVRLYGVLGEWL